MTSDSGTYALLLHANAERVVEVGALGELPVRPGSYVYVGSAFGPGGVRARVRRHARANASPHWHIDYLRTVTTLGTVWYTHDDIRRECSWARVLHDLPGARLPCDGFGASDCKCESHLVRFDAASSFAVFREQLQARSPEHASIHRVDGRAMDV